MIKSIGTFFLVIIIFLCINAINAEGSSIALKSGKEVKVPDSIQTKYYPELSRLIKQLERQKHKSSLVFLDRLFYKTHNKILKNYTKYNSSLDELFEKGNYDCVTGSLLYALILDHFEIPYKIIETDFHAFVIVKPGDKEYIFEVTDPFGGFIHDKKEVLNFKIKYFPDRNSLGLNSASEIGRRFYTSDEGNTIYNEIDFMQLYALQHYNHGILALNQKEYSKALNEIKMAYTIYPSKRVTAILAISESLSK